MKIRQLREGDLDALAAVYLEAYDPTWTQEGARRYLDKFRGFEPDSCYVIQEDDGSLSGAILAYSYTRKTGLVIFIQELFVNPEHRKHGYGKRLVSTLRDSFSEKHRVNVVPLIKADTTVMSFYNSLGFEKDQGVFFMDDF
jgi:L-amino acid N-acyltransferase YncA